MRAVEGAGVELACRVDGSGPPVLLVHGIADDSRGWERLTRELVGDARVVAYDRRGYGASGAPEPYARTTVAEQAEDAAALVRALDAAPAVVGGRDLGALVALDRARRHRSLVRGLAAIDPSTFALAPSANQALAAERLMLEDALRDGGPGRALAAFLAARGADEERLARVRDHTGAFFADYAGLATLEATRRELRDLPVPLVVVSCARAAPHEREAAEGLAALVSSARLAPEAELVPALRELVGA